MSAVIDAAADTHPVATPPRSRGPVRRQPVSMPDVALVAGLTGLAATAPLPAVLRALLVGAFVFVGPGAAFCAWVRLPRAARAAAVPTLGMSAMTLVSLTAMWSYRWSTTGILVLSALAVIAASLGHYQWRSGWPNPRTWGRTAWSVVRDTVAAPGINAATLLLFAALICWAAAIPGLPGVDASFYGLLFSGRGILLIPAMALTTAAFVVATVSGRTAAATAAVGVAIVVARVTTWLGTEIPVYDWTYKHLAVVDYILAHDLIAPNGTDIYAQWPAFFVTAAWFCEVTGLPVTTLAHVFAPIIHILIAIVVYSAARVIGLSARVAVAAAFIVETVNWVGQDYFSPQAWSLVIAYGLITLLLASRGAPRTAAVAIIPFAAIVPTHQLTPFCSRCSAHGDRSSPSIPSCRRNVSTRSSGNSNCTAGARVC